jgi:hypothetical protein
LSLNDIKTLNTAGIWSGDAYTYNGVTHTILTNETGAIIGIKVNGTASGDSYLRLGTSVLNMVSEDFIL